MTSLAEREHDDHKNQLQSSICNSHNQDFHQFHHLFQAIPWTQSCPITHNKLIAAWKTITMWLTFDSCKQGFQLKWFAWWGFWSLDLIPITLICFWWRFGCLRDTRIYTCRFDIKQFKVSTWQSLFPFTIFFTWYMILLNK